jgi:hypothetical protein
MKILLIVGVIIAQIILGRIISSYSPPKIIVDYTVVSKSSRRVSVMVGKVIVPTTKYYLVINDGHNIDEEIEVNHDEYQTTNESDAKQYACKEYREYSSWLNFFIGVMFTIDAFLIIHYIVFNSPISC